MRDLTGTASASFVVTVPQHAGTVWALMRKTLAARKVPVPEDDAWK